MSDAPRLYRGLHTNVNWEDIVEISSYTYRPPHGTDTLVELAVRSEGLNSATAHLSPAEARAVAGLLIDLANDIEAPTQPRGAA
jgi:hypothetical protein